MKFKVGNRVEVLGRNEGTYGSWFPAKILAVDGLKYSVRYEHFLTAAGEPVVEKVHEEDIRPRPPTLQGEERWIFGDIVEVFDLHSWKVGKIAKVLQNNYFVVRIFGSIQLKEFHVASLRVHQVWHGNQWVMNDKVCGNKKFDNGYTHSNSNYTAQNFKFTTFDCGANGTIFKEAYTGEKVQHEHDVTGTGKKRKAIKKVGGCHLQIERKLRRKVDAISFSKTMVVENCTCTSTSDGIIRYVEMDVDDGTTKDHAMHSSSIPLQIIEENNECSVASCSGNSFPEYTTRNSKKCSRELVITSFDNANSQCPLKSGEEYVSVSEDKLAADIHELELHAYQSTMQALYASGPLSWEQESLLTNLRISLHISNEEHLLQLRNLLSG